MRLAIISDIHGNLEALTQALAVIDAERVDEVVCLGDTVGYGADPNECIEVVRKRCPVSLLGNHDAAAIDLSGAEYFNAYARASAFWTNGVLSLEHKRFLRSLSLTSRRDNILFVHASPSHPEDWDYIIEEFGASRALRAFSEKICFVGHSHVPGIFSESGMESRVNREGRYIVNVGSIGQPRDGDPRFSFGLFDTSEWTYEARRGEYDVETARRKILEAGLPRQLGDRLLIGR